MVRIAQARQEREFHVEGKHELVGRQNPPLSIRAFEAEFLNAVPVFFVRSVSASESRKVGVDSPPQLVSQLFLHPRRRWHLLPVFERRREGH